MFSSLRDEYWNNSDLLRPIAGILERLGDETKKYVRNWATTIKARIQTLNLKEELEEKTLKPFKEFIKKSEQEIAELKRATDEKLRTSERHSIQIIGIFAAIIAFIVTIVPTAVRLGGASIPIALAGLAIVTAGIIILLAMIFGRREKTSCWLIAGLIITIVLFLAWITGTVLAAIHYPNILISS